MVKRLAPVLLLSALAGCAPPLPRRLVVSEALRRPPPAAPAARDAAAATAIAPQRYVIRLAQAGKVWELELPEQAGGYEVRIPLAGGGPAEMLTPADEELLADFAAASPAGGDGKADPRVASLDPKAAAAKKSYLGGLAKVSELYQARRYELALVEAVNLEAAYPRDARVVAMKGSLYVKLGRKRLAREAWQKALSLNPSDAGVAEALRELGDVEE
jgi:tetratricopeptide (TPR) repeat protein